MKRILILLFICALLAGCGTDTEPVVTEVTQHPVQESTFDSRFGAETVIHLSDEGMDVTGPGSLSVFRSKDIVYYEDRDTYESGRPYGEGEPWERHSKEEAEAHTVVNITAPGTYRVTGKLSAGQIRIDLGEDACDDPNAVVELILDGLDITCTVAPAIVFQNVYECDGDWDKDTARPDVDTSAAGANLILAGENYVNGSHVAKIFKDKKNEKKLWKQDAAIYSYMSMNVYGPGSLELTADNEGLGTELHLTVFGGDITIRSGNDGINTNEDGVSVTAIHGGNLKVLAGLGAEGDGIDSNGYLVISGGTVISAAHPASDAGLDSDKGSYIHGGTVIALGAAMDWAETDSRQVTMNLQFANYRSGTDAITVKDEAGEEIFSFDPAAVLGEDARRYQGVILSCEGLEQGKVVHLYVDSEQMAYTGTDVKMHGPGGMGGQHPEGDRGPRGDRPEGEMPTMPEGQEPPQGDQQPPQGGQQPPDMPGGRPGEGAPPSGEGSTVFFLQDMVNFFSGVTEAE